MRGRYSHVAAVMEGRVLLVAGGYSGVARGDLVAYKVPLFISSEQGDRVSEYGRKKRNRKCQVCFRTGGRNYDKTVSLCVFVVVVLYQDAVCAEALDESMCLKNPECSWCEGRCREYQPTNPVKLTFSQSSGCSHIVRHSKYFV